MSSAKPFLCRCGHLQSDHAFSVGACKCGCTEPRRKNGRHLEILAVVYLGVPGKVAPTYRVRCPGCRREYTTSSWLRELLRRQQCRACSDGEKLVKKWTRRTPRAERPSDLPAPEVFADRPHGMRVRYVAGCRCEDCREANRAYARMQQKLARQGQGNPLVDAGRVRRHLAKLSRAGIGTKTVHDITGVSRTNLVAIVAGAKRQLRRNTAAKILAVTREATHDAKLVDVGPTRRRIARLLQEGFTKGQIARRLGCQRAALQILKRGRITAKTEHKVEGLYKEIIG
jgi:hypothetical protein